MMDDVNAIGALGNGRVLAYVRGPNISSFHAPDYSSPSGLSVIWPETAKWEANIGTRETWRFSNPGMTLHLFAELSEPAVTYRFEGAKTRLRAKNSAERRELGGWEIREDAGRPFAITEVPLGSKIFVYPSSVPRFIAVIGDGVRFGRGSAHAEIEIETEPGVGWLSFVGANSVEQALEIVTRLLSIPVSERELLATKARSQRVKNLRAPGDDLYPIFLQATDQILAQQSEHGGFVAGDTYPLSYMRDQYGTCAGLVAAGLYEPAERALQFRLDKFKRFGDLANAESMGVDDVRHVHENDDVEQTAYLILSILDMAEALGTAVPRNRISAIVWCLEQQHQHLVLGALPFNGDETYIAGGMLPRWAIEDGSLEATVLYAECLRRLLPYASAADFDALDAQWLEQERATIAAEFEGNFVRDGVLITNSTRRRSGPQRKTRVGVCESCGRFPLQLSRTTDTHRYVCVDCRENTLALVPDEELFIPSAALMAIATDNSLISREIGLATIERAAEGLTKQAERGLSTGYDDGLLARVTSSSESVLALRTKLISQRDEYGTWAEYYRGDAPVGTRCRPWETGMNLLALFEIENYSHKKDAEHDHV